MEVEFEGLAGVEGLSDPLMFPNTELAVEGKRVEVSHSHGMQLKIFHLRRIVQHSAADEIREY